MTTPTLFQPGFLAKLKCLLFGHKYLVDGAIKERETPTLTSFIYKEDATTATSVGLCFCPRCYAFHGAHYTQNKEHTIEKITTKPKKNKKAVSKPKTKTKTKTKTKK